MSELHKAEIKREDFSSRVADLILPAERELVQGIRPQTLAHLKSLQTSSVLDRSSDMVCFRTDDIFSLITALDQGYFKFDSESFMDKENQYFFTTPNPESSDLRNSLPFASLEFDNLRFGDPGISKEVATLNQVLDRHCFQYGAMGLNVAIVRGILPLVDIPSVLNQCPHLNRSIEELVEACGRDIEKIEGDLSRLKNPRCRTVVLRDVLDHVANSDIVALSHTIRDISNRGGVLVAFSKQILNYHSPIPEDSNELAFDGADKRILSDCILCFESLGDFEDSLLERLQGDAVNSFR